MTNEEKAQCLNEEAEKIKDTLSKIKHRVAVFSGKGGVGKRTLKLEPVNLLIQVNRRFF